MGIFKKFFWFYSLLFLSFPAILWAQIEPGLPPGDGAVTLGDPLSGAGVEEILNNIVNWLLVIAAPIAVIMTIWAGYLFMTGGSNEEQIKKARSTLLYVVIGIVVLILSKAIITLVASFIG